MTPGPASATEADIAACFRLLLGRAPSAEEWEGHRALAGQPLAAVVRNYLDSPEHAQHFGRGTAGHGIRLVQADGFVLYAAEDDLAVGRPVAAGTYEPEVAAAFRQHLRPGMTAVDVGANIGYFTMLAASLVGPSGAVLAVEPNPANLRLLEASRRANGFTQVAVAGCAVGRRIGMLALETAYSNGVTSEPGADPAALLQARLVPAVPLSRLLPERPIGFIKIDAEGTEHTAMSDILDVLRRDQPVIVSEFSPTLLEKQSGVPAKGYLYMLQSVGYRVAVIDGAGGFPCVDPAAVMARLAASGGDHVDLLLTPRRR